MKETIGSTGTVPGHRALVAGEQWHRSDFTMEMLPEGYRPLLMGEREMDEDEWRSLLSQKWKKTPDPGIIVGTTFLLRTTRPLPVIKTPAAPQPQQSSYSDGGQAFPSAALFDQAIVDTKGMTLRDWFAGMAIGDLAIYSMQDEWARSGPEWRDAAAGEAYKFADAMLKAREVLP